MHGWLKGINLLQQDSSKLRNYRETGSRSTNSDANAKLGSSPYPRA